MHRARPQQTNDEFSAWRFIRLMPAANRLWQAIRCGAQASLAGKIIGSAAPRSDQHSHALDLQ
jgi:hypothetical protein